MTRLIPLLLSALLSALASGVDAKSKGDQIRMYQFTSDYCDGMPSGANVDIKRDECVNIDARSIKPRLDEKRKKWLSDVNNGATQCALIIWGGPGCSGENEDLMYFPQEIEHCYTAVTHMPLRSVKFYCGPDFIVANQLEVLTTTLEATSWSIGPGNTMTPIASTHVITVSNASPTTLQHARRDLEPRDKNNIRNVWMYHPWSRSILCYECYTKKPDDFSWVKCRSNRLVNHLCGARPVDFEGNPSTSTTTSTTSTTTTTTAVTIFPETLSTSTFTLELPATAPLSSAASSLVPRSWHKKVNFQLPWNKARACADAEWEKRGKANTEIRLQEVHVDGGDDCKDSESLDLPDTVVLTDTVTTTSTTTFLQPTFTAVATVTETIYTSASVVTITFSEPAETTPTPSVVTITTLTPTEITITTLVPRSIAHASAGNVPPHSDL